MTQNTINNSRGYKVIFSDIDGTILDDNDRLSKRNINAIKNIINNGMVFVFASGRSTRSIKKLFSEIDRKDFNTIAFNGCEISIKGKLVYRKTLSNSSAIDIATTAMKQGIHVHAYSKNNLVFHEKSEIAYRYSKHANLEPLFVESFIEYLRKKSITKLLIIAEPGDLFEINKYFKRKFSNVNFVISGPEYLDVLPTEVDKGKAVAFVCNELGISNDDVVVIGDSENDLPMIEKAGLSIVMENGLDKLKDRADIVAPSNQDNGFAKIVEKLFKI